MPALTVSNYLPPRASPQRGARSLGHAPVVLLLLALLLAAGCSEGTGPAETTEPGLHVVLRPVVSDTVEAELTQALVVEVRDQQGQPMSGVAVVFEASVVDDRPTLSFARSGSRVFTAIAADTTDRSGRASVLVRLGTKAGAAEALISAPALGMRTSAAFTIVPGAAVTLGVAPADTAVYVGRQYTLRGLAHDRFGNAHASVSFTAASPIVSVAGASIRGEQIGRGFLIARSGALTDTAWVSVVPQGVLAAYEFPIYFNSPVMTIQQPGRIVILNTDGSEYRVLLEQQPAVVPFSFAGGMHPSWAPSGQELAYINADRLMAVSLAGGTRELVSGGQPVHVEFTPLFSPDGEWIYFTRGRDGHQRTFWRVRPDGTGAAQVSPPENWGVDVMPSPDPTGQFVAYHTNRATNSPIDFTVRSMNVGTGAVSPIDVSGMYPRWSPRGDRIAYLSTTPYQQHLWLVRPDGSERQLLGAGIGAHPAFSWSPDGAWVAISGALPRRGGYDRIGLSLVNVATGQVLPLSFDRTLVQPSWRR